MYRRRRKVTSLKKKYVWEGVVRFLKIKSDSRGENRLGIADFLLHEHSYSCTTTRRIYYYTYVAAYNQPLENGPLPTPAPPTDTDSPS